MTASRIEAVFEVEASASLTRDQRDQLLRMLGPRVDAVSQDARGQARNRELALARLAEKIAAALVVRRKRRPTRPGRGAREERLKDKRKRSERKRRRRRPEIED